MGESPIFSCHAHVFTIDPKTKKTWLPASSQAIKVSFFFDKLREQYRILSIDDAAQDPARKMPINSIVTEKMSFKKTSQKFGQWADTASGTVFGLGFGHESELDRFVEQFCQALDHTRRLRKQQQQQQQQHQEHFSGDFVDLPVQHHQQQQQLHQPSTTTVDNHHHHHGDVANWRGEVDRLTGQLQQTSVSLQKVERENQALRSGGARAAESDARVAQLEKENFMLRTRVKQLEDTVAQLDQQLKVEVPAVAAEVQRRLLEAGDVAAQLARLTTTAASATTTAASATSGGGGHNKY